MLFPSRHRFKKGRQYSGVEELDYGEQAQVDFGFYNMMDQNGTPQKICFMATVLSRSRQKHLYFLDRPFTTQDVIEAQEAALLYYGGIPRQFVYDQDKLMIVSENGGEILYTEKFKAYIKARKFEIFVCRKGDPETKGKVENVVKYVKSNFLKHRIYKELKILNAESLAWLERTGNGQVHGTTKKIPSQDFLIEKPYLRPLKPLKLDWLSYRSHHVRKDNLIWYKSNRYSVPVGTYQGPRTKVWAKEQGDELVIYNDKKEEIARHQIATGKGVTVSKSNHKRDNTPKINDLISDVSKLFSHQNLASQWLRQIQKLRGRYIRDQLLIIKKHIQKHGSESANKALVFCRENAIYNATDFASVMQMFDNPDDTIATQKPPPEQLVLEDRQRKHLEAKPQQSNIADYQKIVHPV